MSQQFLPTFDPRNDFEPRAEKTIRPPANRTPTSQAAAEAITPHAARQERAVLEVIRTRSQLGATRKEIAHVLGIEESSVCGRVDALLAKRLVHADGDRVPLVLGAKRKQAILRVSKIQRKAVKR